MNVSILTILFEATRTFGVKRFSFTKRDFAVGKMIIAFVPILYDPEAIVKRVSIKPCKW